MNDSLRTQALTEMQRQNLSARKLAARLQLRPETVLDFVHGRRKTHALVSASICRELGLVLSDTTSREGSAA